MEYYGDNPASKAKDSLRDVFGNINGLIHFLDNDKDMDIWYKVRQLQADSLGLSELNLDWRLVPKEANMYARLRQGEQTPAKSVVAYNTSSTPITKVQYGGCATISFGSLIPRVVATERDPSGLGRWVSQLLEGRKDHRTRLVAGYFPCKNMGQKTVYTQHRSHFNKLPEDHPQWKAEPLKSSIHAFKGSAFHWGWSSGNLLK